MIPSDIKFWDKDYEYMYDWYKKDYDPKTIFWSKIGMFTEGRFVPYIVIKHIEPY